MPTSSRPESDDPSLDDRVRTERVLAAARLFVSLVASAAAWLGAPGAAATPAIPIAGYACLSLLALLLSRVAPSEWLPAAGYALHIVDLISVVTFAVLAPGHEGLSLIFFVFVLLSAATRWGSTEGWRPASLPSSCTRRARGSHRARLASTP